MLKLEDVVIPLKKTDKAYSAESILFLDRLSKYLRRNQEAKKYSDVMFFAFWCRRANIEKAKEKFQDDYLHKGRGLAFHIAPSNVPINFAFSFAFGVLSGNANIVRLPSKNDPQVAIICDGIQYIFQTEFPELGRRNLFIQYDKENEEFTKYFSSICDVRIIWGGDATIANVRKYTMPPRAVEIVFANRYSIGIIEAKAIIEATSQQLQRMAEGFYNDTYLMDQNACSSPQIVFWDEENKVAQEIFWNQVYQYAKKYDLTDYKAGEKYYLASKYAAEIPEIRSFENYENLVYVMDLSGIPENITRIQSKYGVFFQYSLSDLEEILPVLNESVQTCVYWGDWRERLLQLVETHSVQGLDRIVPVGDGLKMDVIWDGYDIIRNLSRIVYA